INILKKFFFSSSSSLSSLTEQQQQYNYNNNNQLLLLTQLESTNQMSLFFSIFIGLLLFILIFLCVLGNLLVILAILIERDLRCRPQYYLIFSLAVADLMVGILITPLGAWTTLRQKWEMGVTLCDFWISVDVLVCTSSILHLVAIALDRYWSITNIYYTQNRTPQRIFTMLFVIWVLSLLISLAPQFEFLHLKDNGFVSRVEDQKICLISQDIAYQIFSTSTAFYIPLCAIIIIYYKIMRAAKKRFRRERDRKTLNRGVIDDSSIPLKTSKQLDLEQQNSSPIAQKTSAGANNCSDSPIFQAKQKEQNGRHFSINRNFLFFLKITPDSSPKTSCPTEFQEKVKLQNNLGSIDVVETEFQANEEFKNGIKNGDIIQQQQRQIITFPKHLKMYSRKE
ncbi:G_PROTEIN_RECEP_F1_2 domain-containing protein, partial [Meloidogyne graminicola]